MCVEEKMKVFISHKREDEEWARLIVNELQDMGVVCYLDVLDRKIEEGGKQLTNHIKRNLNRCTDIIVIMSERTRLSQWVPFEVGMAAEVDMPTATFLIESVELPDFLQYWPRLKRPEDIRKYVTTKKAVNREYSAIYESVMYQKPQIEEFYDRLKKQLYM